MIEKPSETTTKKIRKPCKARMDETFEKERERERFDCGPLLVSCPRPKEEGEEEEGEEEEGEEEREEGEKEREEEEKKKNESLLPLLLLRKIWRRVVESQGRKGMGSA